MGSRIESTRAEAKRLFLGTGGVVGVGIANDTGHGLLTFLMSEDQQQTRQQIESWAMRNEVAVEFLVTGSIRIRDQEKEK
jgi:Tfp pilus assembly protein PilN